MPATLRRRIYCHYCSKRLNTAQKAGRRIRCESCLADNYLDENNSIIDVPVEVAQGPIGQVNRLEVASDSDIFCRTCLKNQQLYVQALSEYLPDPDDPQYDELENALPTYKKELELRYPQCCPQCEPRVQASLQQANYAAKTDHLRRMLYKKSDASRRSFLHYKRLIVAAAGVGQVLGLVLQMTWHALASQLSTGQGFPDTNLWHCVRTLSLTASCPEQFASLLPVSFLIGLLCIWWNPKWQHKLAGQDGRLEGLNRYYQLQILLLMLRFSIWMVLRDLPGIEVYKQAIHSFCLVFLGMSSMYAWFGVVRVSNAPLVDWNQPQKPLVDPNQFMQPEPRERETATTGPFTLENLDRSHGARYEAWQPPTPPADADNMEWESTASQSALNARPRPIKQKFNQISPFYGNLPAQPTRGSLNPRNPPPPAPCQALGIPPGFFGLSKSAGKVEAARIDDYQQQKNFKPASFFAHDRDADTGLENLFDSFFSVKDNTAPAQSNNHKVPVQMPQQTPPRAQNIDAPSPLLYQHHKTPARPILSMAISCTIILGLSITATSLCWLEYLLGGTTEAPSTMLIYTAFIPFLHVFEDALRSPNVTLTSLGRIVQGMLILASWFVVPEDGTQYVPIWNKLVIGVVLLLIMEEIYRCCRLQHFTLRQRGSMVTGQQSTTHLRSLASLAASVTQHDQPRPSQQPELFNPFLPGNRVLGRRGSIESLDSSTSTQTRQSATTAGWNTPHANHRSSDWHPDQNKFNNGSALDALSSRSSIAGTRTRRR